MNNFERSSRFRWCQNIIEKHGLVLNTRNILLFEKLWDDGKTGDEEAIQAIVNKIREDADDK